MTDFISQDEQKSLLAREAARLVEPGMVLGLGTGSTVARFIEALASDRERAAGLTLVPTSRASAALAEEAGFLAVFPRAGLTPDLLVDGADEVARDLSMIKGGGGALLWEKIVARASKRRVYLADETKLVARLGAFPLPVEIVRFGHDYTGEELRRLVTRADLRADAQGDPFTTDSGNFIYDCVIRGTEDYAALDAALSEIPGVVTSGLFVGLADAVLAIADGAATLVSGSEDVFW